MSSSFVDTTATSSVADSSSALQCTTECSNVDCTKDTLVVRMDTEKQSLEGTPTHHHSCDPLDSTNCPCHESKENQTCNQNISSGTTIASTTSPTTGVLHTRVTPSSGGSTSVGDINNSNVVNNNGVAGGNGSNSNNSDINAVSSLSQQQHQSPSSAHHLPFANPNHHHSSSAHQHQSQNHQTSQSQLLFRSQQNSSSSLFNALSSPPNAPSRFFLNESLTKTSPMTSMPHQLSSSLPNTSPLMSPVSTTATRMSTTSGVHDVAVQAEENDLINSASSASSPTTIAVASSSTVGGGGKSSRGVSQSNVSKKFHSSSSTHRKGSEIAGESVPDAEGDDDDEEEEDTSSSSEPVVPLDTRNKWYRYPVIIPNEHRMVINKLRADGHIRTEKVYQTMLQVNFGNFGSWSYSYR